MRNPQRRFRGLNLRKKDRAQLAKVQGEAVSAQDGGRTSLRRGTSARPGRIARTDYEYKRLWHKLTVHYTPKHASWLNQQRRPTSGRPSELENRGAERDHFHTAIPCACVERRDSLYSAARRHRRKHRPSYCCFVTENVPSATGLPPEVAVQVPGHVVCEKRHVALTSTLTRPVSPPLSPSS